MQKYAPNWKWLIIPVLIIISSLSAEETNELFALKSNRLTEIQEIVAPGNLEVFSGNALYFGGGIVGEFNWEDPAHSAPEVSTDGFRVATDSDAWENERISLPEGVAAAAVTAIDGAIYVVGGYRDEGISNRVSKWQWVEGKWDVTDLALLPDSLAWASTQIMDNVLYVAGGVGPSGQNEKLYSLDMGDLKAGWKAKTTLAVGEGWLEPLMVVRRDEKAIRNVLLLFGGWTVDTGRESGWSPFMNGWKFQPNDAKGEKLTAMANPPEDELLKKASGLGPSHVMITSTPVASVTGYPPMNETTDSNTGFLRYHLFTNTWAPFTAGWPGSIMSLHWLDKKQVIIGGVDADGKLKFHDLEIVATERHFNWLDYTVMVLYMLGLVAIGRYFAMREKGTEDFFLGGRKIPWWAAGLSIYATGTSAISFMAIPAKTYATDWLYFIGMSIFPFFTVLIAAYVFIPLLRKLELTTVMEYFELRFGRSVRLLMSAIAVLGQVAGRMSITLLLPSIALTAVTGMNIYVCILLMGILATIYTAVGGINAVIWTDVLQVFVLFGGAILSFVLILSRVDGGFGTMMTLAVQDNKFNFFDWNFDLTTATMWVMILWAVSDVFGKGLGQEGLQRAFSTKGVKEARRSMITCAVVALPAGLLFYGIGTALYSFYFTHPDLLNPTLQTDAIFPLFIAQQLPAGLAGLVISGLFAASMSTLDTAMNTTATIVTRDFYSIWQKDADDHTQLRLAKWVTIACGVFGTGIALYLASFGNLGSLWDMFSLLLGVIGGGLGGIGFLALCTTRAHTWGTLAGAGVTAIAMILIQRYTPIHFFIYGTISLVIGGTTGYLFSLIIPNPTPKNLRGLTLWTMKS